MRTFTAIVVPPDENVLRISGDSESLWEETDPCPPLECLETSMGLLEQHSPSRVKVHSFLPFWRDGSPIFAFRKLWCDVGRTD